MQVYCYTYSGDYGGGLFLASAKNKEIADLKAKAENTPLEYVGTWKELRDKATKKGTLNYLSYE